MTAPQPLPRRLLVWTLSLLFLAGVGGAGVLAFGRLSGVTQALIGAGWAGHLGVPPDRGAFTARCLFDDACSRALGALWERGLPGWLWLLPALPLLALAGARLSQRAPARKDPGEARWAVARDLRPYLHGRRGSRALVGYLGLLNGKRLVRLPENARCAHTLIVGGTGAGKTTRYLNTNLLLDARDRVSAVVFDLKYPDPHSGFLEVVNYFRAYGRRVYAFTPFDPDSARLPLLSSVRTFQDAFDLAELFRPQGATEGDPFYRNNERQLLAALVLGVARDPQPSLYQVYRLLGLGTDELKAYVAARPHLQGSLTALLNLRPDMLAGICTGLAGDLQVFTDPNLNRATSAGPGRAMDLRRLCLEPGLLYIGVPQEQIQGGKGQVLLRLLKRVLDQAILSVAGEHGGRLPQHLSIYLDEFPSFGPLPNIGENLATMRSRRVAYHIAMQNRAQGEAIYGRDAFRAMVNNNFAQMVIFPRSLRLEDAQFFAENLGQITVLEESRGVRRGPGWLGALHGRQASLMTREVARALLSAEAMRTFPDGSAVVELTGVPPATVRMPRLDERDNPLCGVYRKIQAAYALPQLRAPRSEAPDQQGAAELPAPTPLRPEAPRNPLAEGFRDWIAGLLDAGTPLHPEFDAAGKPLGLTVRPADLNAVPEALPAWTEKGWVVPADGHLGVSKLGLSRVERLWRLIRAHAEVDAVLRWAADHAGQLEHHPRQAPGVAPIGAWSEGKVSVPPEVAVRLLGLDSVEFEPVALGDQVVPLTPVRWALAAASATP